MPRGTRVHALTVSALDMFGAQFLYSTFFLSFLTPQLICYSLEQAQGITAELTFALCIHQNFIHDIYDTSAKNSHSYRNVRFRNPISGWSSRKHEMNFNISFHSCSWTLGRARSPGKLIGPLCAPPFFGIYHRSYRSPRFLTVGQQPCQVQLFATFEEDRYTK
jgi:hypothetical protein